MQQVGYVVAHVTLDIEISEQKQESAMLLVIWTTIPVLVMLLAEKSPFLAKLTKKQSI